MLKGNKGEWSEIYVLFYLLTTGRLYSSDENLTKIEDVYFPIKEIYKEDGKEKTKYQIEDEILIYRNDVLTEKIRREEIEVEKDFLLSELKNKHGSLEIPRTEKYMQKIMCYKLTSGNKKTDIRLKIVDINTGFSPTVGFSIKSKIGKSATLFNASKQTNFIYEIKNSDEEFKNRINKLESISKNKRSIDIRTRIREIIKNKEITFSHIEGETFTNNLEIIDSNLGQILAHCIIYYYNEHLTKLTSIVKALEEDNPLNFGNKKAYEYKIKKFLAAVALGLFPTKKWDGIDEANGGYIVVKNDGEVLAYHLYNRDKFEKYLLNNTSFDTPSTSRHNFGNIYNEKDKYYLNLNFQIRFK